MFSEETHNWYISWHMLWSQTSCYEQPFKHNKHLAWHHAPVESCSSQVSLQMLIVKSFNIVNCLTNFNAANWPNRKIKVLARKTLCMVVWKPVTKNSQAALVMLNAFKQKLRLCTCCDFKTYLGFRCLCCLVEENLIWCKTCGGK